MGFLRREDPGLMIPSEWYYWPDEADPEYQAAIEQWRQDYAAGIDYPPPVRELGRIVFLETNMPPELQGKSVEELVAADVQRVPGDAAVEFITTRYEFETGKKLREKEIVPLLRRYLASIGR